MDADLKSGFHFHVPGSNWDAMLLSMVGSDDLGPYTGDHCGDCGGILDARVIQLFRNSHSGCLDCQEDRTCSMPYRCYSCAYGDQEQREANRAYMRDILPDAVPELNTVLPEDFPHFRTEVTWEHPVS